MLRIALPRLVKAGQGPVWSGADQVEAATLSPIGQVTPVPPRPQ